MPGPLIYVLYRRTTQQVCIYYLLYYLPGWHVDPFICVTDRRHSNHVFTIYSIVYPGGMSGTFICVTDRQKSKYVFTIYSIHGDKGFHIISAVHRRFYHAMHAPRIFRRFF